MGKKIISAAFALLWQATAQGAEPAYIEALNAAPLRAAIPKTAKKTRVAIIGTGIDGRDPELAGKINVAASKSYVDSTPLVGEDPHETYVAKKIAAICGNWCELISLKVAKPQPALYGSGTTTWWSEGGLHSALNEVMSWEGTSVVNLSTAGYYDEVREKLVALQDKAFVALSAGNSGINPVRYPCFYGLEMPHMLCVASVELSGAKSTYSNWGPRAEIAGFGTLSPAIQGTSFAAPDAAALAGLLMSLGDFSPALVEKFLKVGGFPNPQLKGLIGEPFVSGEGLQLNGGGALNVVRRLQSIRLTGYRPAAVHPGELVNLQVSEDLVWLAKFDLAIKLESESRATSFTPATLNFGLQFSAPALPGRYLAALWVEASLSSEELPIIVSAPPLTRITDGNGAPPRRQNGLPRDRGGERGR